jgi:hypothetical protein
VKKAERDKVTGLREWGKLHDKVKVKVRLSLVLIKHHAM